MDSVKVLNDLYWVGVLDPDLRVFDIVVPTEEGTTYNSYLVIGKEKKALIEANKLLFKDEYIKTVESVCSIKDIDYIILNHTEPDHSGTLPAVVDINPDIEVIYSKTAKSFIQNILNRDFKGRTVGDGDLIDLGGKTLSFFHTPFLHWPDTMFTYLNEDNILFPCDFLGAHYCGEELFNDMLKDKGKAEKAFRFYYSSIMRPYKEHIILALNKIKDLKINMVCPSHGPILREDIDYYINFYKEQAGRYYKHNKNKQITLIYATAYGNTEMMAKKIKEGINDIGLDVKIYNTATSNMHDIIDDIEISHGLIIGTATINAKAPKPIFTLFSELVSLNVSNRKAGVFGSYGWSGEGIKMCEDILKTMRMKLPQPSLRTKMTPSAKELDDAFAWGREFGISVLEGN